MKKFYLWVTLALSLNFAALHAQYVTIPDGTFVTWLQTHGYAACLNGNQLDTTCTAVLTATTLSCNYVMIHNLSGVQYFKALTTLDCSQDSIVTIPSLPATLRSLNTDNNYLQTLPALPGNLKTLLCDYNQLSSLGTLPSGLQTLSCVQNNITTLSTLPSTLQSLVCDYNLLSSLPTLPDALQNLSCINNDLHTLPALPASLQNLNCTGDSLTALPALPTALQTLNCNVNSITSLPALPVALTSLQCGTNLLTAIPALPNGLITLYCLQNQVTALPAIPASVTTINCNSNSITVLPALPTGLQKLQCAFNPIANLPTLPANLQLLDCSFNHLTALPLLPPVLASLSCNANSLITLPDLPASLTNLNCGFNQLTSLPALPDSLHSLLTGYNTNLTCLPQLKRIVNIDFSQTGVSCLPNYGNVTTSNPVLISLPLCGLFNTHGCKPFWNITGQVYYDRNADCRFDINDVGMQPVKALLYGGGNLLQQVYTNPDGTYSFDSVPYGNYNVTIDTDGLPFLLSCPGGTSYAVQLSGADSVSYSNNFGFVCRPQGFDVGVQNMVGSYASPNNFELNVVAGDMSQAFGGTCAGGVSGQVQLVYNGPVTYVAPATGATTPTSINSNTITWSISNFANVNAQTAFNLMFKTDSSAGSGTEVCFTLTVTAGADDYNLQNNVMHYCFTTGNDAVGNVKEVSPLSNFDSSTHWLTYTIRFQNKGNSTATNMVIYDTLSANLDASSVQLLAYSAPNFTEVLGNVVIFSFPNIDLPYSAANDSGSRGFVQFKVRPVAGLPVGTTITNNAAIVFDSSSAIITNTVSNNLIIDSTVGVSQVTANSSMVQMYPNPANNFVTLTVPYNMRGTTLEICDPTGRTVSSQKISASFLHIETSQLAKGVYIVRITDERSVWAVKKLIIQ